jgi:hypothetical protein
MGFKKPSVLSKHTKKCHGLSMRCTSGIEGNCRCSMFWGIYFFPRINLNCLHQYLRERCEESIENVAKDTNELNGGSSDITIASDSSWKNAGHP